MEMIFDTPHIIILAVLAALALGFGGWYGFLGSLLGLTLGELTAWYILFYRSRKKLTKKP